MSSHSMRRFAGCVPICFERISDCETATSTFKCSPKLLLINSRKNEGLLVFPKGGIKRGERARAAAVRETFEEAGVSGHIVGRVEKSAENFIVIGDSNGSDSEWDDIGPEVGGSQWYLFVIENISDDWPERDVRRRSWVTLKEASSLKNVSKETMKIIEAVEESVWAKRSKTL